MINAEQETFVEKSQNLVDELANIYDPCQSSALIYVSRMFFEVYQDVPEWLHNTLLSPFRIRLAGAAYLDILDTFSENATSGLKAELLEDIKKATLDDEIDDELFEECIKSADELICGYKLAKIYRLSAAELKQIRLCAANIPDANIDQILKHFFDKNYDEEDVADKFFDIRIKAQNEYYEKIKKEREEIEYLSEVQAEEDPEVGNPIHNTSDEEAFSDIL